MAANSTDARVRRCQICDPELPFFVDAGGRHADKLPGAGKAHLRGDRDPAQAPHHELTAIALAVLGDDRRLA
jgi:hypothetical protein